ncbi:endonuclease/exonuclease/phosphatase family protein [Streptomyces sp. SAI-097]
MPRRTLSVLAAGVALVAAASTAQVSAGDRPPAPQAPGARVVDVMTFNIHHAQGTDDVLDLRRVADVIRRSGADVVGLQEVDRHYSERSDWADQPAELAALLGYHVVFGANIDKEPPSAGGDRVQYGTAILSRHPITSSDNTWLYKSPGQEQRGLLRATIDIRGKKVEVYNTHLAASSQADRSRQTAQIVDLIGAKKPSVLVGDFNALPNAPEAQPLREAYTDAWDGFLPGHGEGATYPASAPTERIDVIYATPKVTPLLTRVVTTRPAASDHLPVISKVVIGP